jgi:prevent-host-death family protein
MQATAKDLRFHSAELLNTVKRGEEVVITYRGKPCAKLVPIEEPDSTVSRNELFGIWQHHDQSKDVGKYLRNLRKSRFDVD